MFHHLMRFSMSFLKLGKLPQLEFEHEKSYGRRGRGWLVFCPGNSLTKSREFLEDGVGRGSPHEGL
jgi:hypothetical protein